MKTYLEKILPHPENTELSVIFKAVEDDVDPSTLSDSYMDESVADEIQLKFYAGNKAAWFTADVIVCKKGDEENLQYPHGKDSLGGCNYHSFEDFMKSEQFQDMIKEATSDMMKNQETVASSPSWHELTEHAIVFGTEEQFKLAQEFDSEYNEEPIFLPCIIEDKGYAPHESYPEFETSDCDDGSYEQMLADGELPEDVDKETFLMDCLKQTLEETWSPDLAPNEKEEQSVESSVPVMTVKDLVDGLGTNDDDCAMIVQNDGTGDSYPVCKIKTINGYTTIIAASCAPKDAYDYLGFLQTLGHFNDSSEIVVLIDNPVAQGEFLVTSIEELDKKIILHVEDSRSLAKTQPVAKASEVSWEEIAPDVWVLGDSKQVECAIQDGDIPLEIPCIAHGNGFEPLSEVPDYTLNDFLADFGSEESNEESKMEQMKHVLGKSYNPEAYANWVEAEIEGDEKLKDFVVAGPGAGVTVALEGRIEFPVLKYAHLEDQGQHVFTFGPVLVDAKFSSYYDTQEASKGLNLQLESYAMDDYEFNRTVMNGKDGLPEKVVFEDQDLYQDGRSLVLSPGWSRAIYKAGDKFQFELGYNGPKGEATFTDNGQYAWEDLDSLEGESETEASGKKTVASDKCLTHTFSDAEFDFDLEGVEYEDFVPPKYDIEVEQCFEYDSDYGADADGNRGRATWFFGDREILSISKDGKDVDLKSEEGKNLVDKIERDKDFEKMVEKYDWDVSNS